MIDSLKPPRVVGTPEPDANADNDPELAAFLDFAPVPRKVMQPNGWTPERQRRFLELIVQTGSPQGAATAMRKKLSGIEDVYRDDEVGEFRAAWDGICELVRSREEARLQALCARDIPEPPHRRPQSGGPSSGAWRQPFPQPGQVLNEFDEWEDEDSLAARAEDAADSIRGKLLRCRRLFLQQISGSPGKRAAFEILTELPVDWDKAAAGEAQPDEPWNIANQRKPDMVLTAESGWSFGDIGYGPDRKAAARRAIDEHRAAEGLEPLDWDESTESSD